jgi:hypothetical protein
MLKVMRHLLTRAFLLLALPGVAFASFAADESKKVYKWKGNDGTMQYSDQLPPVVNPKSNKYVLDPHGRVRGEIPSTDVYIQQLNALNKKNAPVDPSVKARQDYDRALLQSYLSPHDFDIAQKRALEALQLRVSSTQAVLQDDNQRLQAIQQRKKTGEVVVDGEMSSIQTDISQRQADLVRFQNERERLIKKYASDKARWKLLKAEQPADDQ